ncbi:MAG: hypothetical protein B7Z63_02795 [Ignavibacteriae bacterium 37-53-5]|nr:MAG: hypothetical protein B7Z63_02795 [Ignavibacteriae bacterium 37-53-5]
MFPEVWVTDRNYRFHLTGGVDYRGNFDGEATFGRLFGNMQFLELYVGADVRRLNGLHNFSTNSSGYRIENHALATVGASYILPFFLQANLRLDDTGHFRFQISRNNLALTSRLRLDAAWNTDKEYDVGLRYILIKRLSLSANYDSHFGAGGGITYTY